MYARVARFEGGDPARIDESVAEMKRQMDAARSGQLPAEALEELRTLTETVSRFIGLYDRSTGTSLGIAFCETEEDVRRADAALNEMSPTDDAGTRTGAEIFEVLLDESMR